MISDQARNRKAPPLDGEGLGRGDVSGRVALFIDLTPTQPSPIKGVGL
jgi:hypothetical protein